MILQREIRFRARVNFTMASRSGRGVCTRGPTSTGIQHKSFRILTGIWNLGQESEILSEMKSTFNLIVFVYFL